MAGGQLRDLEHFVDILDTLDAIVWEADASTFDFTYVSEAAERILGYPTHEWIGNPGFWESLIHPDDRADAVAFCRSAAKQGRDHRFDYRAIAADDRVVSLHDVVRVVPDDDGTPRFLRGVMTDVTERRKAERERDDLQRQLLQSQKMDAIGRLAGGVAHDFNNILAAIVNYAAFIRDEPNDPSAVAADATQIVAAAERAAALTRQLLVFSRRETPRPEILDLRDVVTEHAKMLVRVLGERVELRLELSPVPAVIADRIQIEHVLLNLAVNARDAMPQGGPLTITLDTHDGHVRLRVTDAGVGMSEAVRERVFEPFFTTKPRGEGTGLGLSSAYGIVEALDGNIRFHSVEGEGTTVEILLPQARAGARQSSEEATPSESSRGTLSFLVVEDEEQVRKIVQRMLTKDGHEVAVAANARQALLVAEERDDPPDVVITDVVMPGMSGIDLAREVRQRWPATAIVFASGYPRDVVDQEGELEGPLVEKPFTIDGLRRGIAGALSSGGD